jgi:hypothetical protein
MLMEEVVHIPTKKKATVVATKLDKEGKQLIEVKYEGGSKGWTTPDALTSFIQDAVEYDGEFLSE